jgi:integrase
MTVLANNMEASLFKEYLENKTPVLAESTVDQYFKTISRFLANDPDLDSIDSYNQFIIDGAIRKRCWHYYPVIRTFINYKIKAKAKRETLLNNLVKPKINQDIVKERKYLSEEKLFEVINNLEQQKHKIIALIQMLTGVRVGDILRLKYGGIHPETYENKPVLRLNLLGKGRKRNVVYIHDKVAQDLIMEYITFNMGDDDYYFLHIGKINKKRAYKIDNIAKLNYLDFWADLKHSLVKSGIDKKDFSTHDFRRCFARRVWEKYKDVFVLKQMLNHTDPKVTFRYLSQSGLQNIDYHDEMQK